MDTVTKKIALLPGDGIGPEVIGAATTLLQDCAAEFGHKFILEEHPIGGTALDQCGSPLPSSTLEACRSADAILLGAVGGPRWDNVPLEKRPERGLLGLRKELALYINLRPIVLRESLQDISPLKLRPGQVIDFEFVRELNGGIYFGEHRTEGTGGQEQASDLEIYTAEEVERVAQFAFQRAAARRQRLASVDKANVLASSRLWRKVVDRVALQHPETSLEHLYVDNAALQLILRPEEFDVVMTSNMFGDILSDEAAGILGSIGLLPSMSWGYGPSLFEPIHGSAPALAGKDIASPIAAILCAAMMLREAFSLEREAGWIESAVDRVLAQGYRPSDIAREGCTTVSGSEFLQRVRSELTHSAEPAPETAERVEPVEQFEQYGWGV